MSANVPRRRGGLQIHLAGFDSLGARQQGEAHEERVFAEAIPFRDRLTGRTAGFEPANLGSMPSP